MNPTRRRVRPIYGQVIAGPPGAGKTTYCNGMQQYLRLLGRNAQVINLDPANEHVDFHRNRNDNADDDNEKERVENSHEQDGLLPYDTILDSCEDIINLSSVMEEFGLGPNGGLLYCMEYIESHLDEIIVNILQERLTDDTYLLIDLPGQVELYTHGTSVSNILAKLIQHFDMRLSCVQLVDSHYCTDATKFISAALLSTTSMLRLELPTVNVLSKVDLLSKYGALPFPLEFFTDCHDLDRLLAFSGEDLPYPSEEDSSAFVDIASDEDYQKARKKTRQSIFFRKHAKLHKGICEVLEDFSLLSYLPLNISDAASVGRVLASVDKSNGYVFLSTESSSSNNGVINQDLFNCAIQADQDGYESSIANVQEHYLTNQYHQESIAELDRDSRKLKSSSK